MKWRRGSIRIVVLLGVILSVSCSSEDDDDYLDIPDERQLFAGLRRVPKSLTTSKTVVPTRPSPVQWVKTPNKPISVRSRSSESYETSMESSSVEDHRPIVGNHGFVMRDQHRPIIENNHRPSKEDHHRPIRDNYRTNKGDNHRPIIESNYRPNKEDHHRQIIENNYRPKVQQKQAKETQPRHAGMGRRPIGGVIHEVNGHGTFNQSVAFTKTENQRIRPMGFHLKKEDSWMTTVTPMEFTTLPSELSDLSEEQRLQQEFQAAISSSKEEDENFEMPQIDEPGQKTLSSSEEDQFSDLKNIDFLTTPSPLPPPPLQPPSQPMPNQILEPQTPPTIASDTTTTVPSIFDAIGPLLKSGLFQKLLGGGGFGPSVDGPDDSKNDNKTTDNLRANSPPMGFDIQSLLNLGISPTSFSKDLPLKLGEDTLSNLDSESPLKVSETMPPNSDSESSFKPHDSFSEYSATPLPHSDGGIPTGDLHDQISYKKQKIIRKVKRLKTNVQPKIELGLNPGDNQEHRQTNLDKPRSTMIKKKRRPQKIAFEGSPVQNAEKSDAKLSTQLPKLVVIQSVTTPSYDSEQETNTPSSIDNTAKTKTKSNSYWLKTLLEPTSQTSSAEDRDKKNYSSSYYRRGRETSSETRDLLDSSKSSEQSSMEDDSGFEYGTLDGGLFSSDEDTKEMSDLDHDNNLNVLRTFLQFGLRNPDSAPIKKDIQILRPPTLVALKKVLNEHAPQRSKGTIQPTTPGYFESQELSHEMDDKSSVEENTNSKRPSSDHMESESNPKYFVHVFSRFGEFAKSGLLDNKEMTIKDNSPANYVTSLKMQWDGLNDRDPKVVTEAYQDVPKLPDILLAAAALQSGETDSAEVDKSSSEVESDHSIVKRSAEESDDNMGSSETKQYHFGYRSPNRERKPFKYIVPPFFIKNETSDTASKVHNRSITSRSTKNSPVVLGRSNKALTDLTNISNISTFSGRTKSTVKKDIQILNPPSLLASIKPVLATPKQAEAKAPQVTKTSNDKVVLPSPSQPPQSIRNLAKNKVYYMKPEQFTTPPTNQEITQLLNDSPIQPSTKKNYRASQHRRPTTKPPEVKGFYIKQEQSQIPPRKNYRYRKTTPQPQAPVKSFFKIGGPVNPQLQPLELPKPVVSKPKFVSHSPPDIKMVVSPNSQRKTKFDILRIPSNPFIGNPQDLAPTGMVFIDGHLIPLANHINKNFVKRPIQPESMRYDNNEREYEDGDDDEEHQTNPTFSSTSSGGPHRNNYGPQESDNLQTENPKGSFHNDHHEIKTDFWDKVKSNEQEYVAKKKELDSTVKKMEKQNQKKISGQSIQKKQPLQYGVYYDMHRPETQAPFKDGSTLSHPEPLPKKKSFDDIGKFNGHKDPYPALSHIPKTSFRCQNEKYHGYYADKETNCQVFHLCSENGEKHSFLCPTASLFNQELLICDWWHRVNCDKSESMYSVNAKLYPQSSHFHNPQTQNIKYKDIHLAVKPVKYNDKPKTQPTKNFLASMNTTSYQAKETPMKSIKSSTPKNFLSEYKTFFHRPASLNIDTDDLFSKFQDGLTNDKEVKKGMDYAKWLHEEKKPVKDFKTSSWAPDREKESKKPPNSDHKVYIVQKDVQENAHVEGHGTGSRKTTPGRDTNSEHHPQSYLVSKLESVHDIGNVDVKNVDLGLDNDYKEQETTYRPDYSQSEEDDDTSEYNRGYDLFHGYQHPQRPGYSGDNSESNENSNEKTSGYGSSNPKDFLPETGAIPKTIYGGKRPYAPKSQLHQSDPTSKGSKDCENSKNSKKDGVTYTHYTYFNKKTPESNSRPDSKRMKGTSPDQDEKYGKVTVFKQTKEGIWKRPDVSFEDLDVNSGRDKIVQKPNFVESSNMPTRGKEAVVPLIRHDPSGRNFPVKSNQKTFTEPRYPSLSSGPLRDARAFGYKINVNTNMNHASVSPPAVTNSGSSRDRTLNEPRHNGKIAMGSQKGNRLPTPSIPSAENLKKQVPFHGKPFSSKPHHEGTNNNVPNRHVPRSQVKLRIAGPASNYRANSAKRGYIQTPGPERPNVNDFYNNLPAFRSTKVVPRDFLGDNFSEVRPRGQSQKVEQFSKEIPYGKKRPPHSETITPKIKFRPGTSAQNIADMDKNLALGNDRFLGGGLDNLPPDKGTATHEWLDNNNPYMMNAYDLNNQGYQSGTGNDFPKMRPYSQTMNLGQTTFQPVYNGWPSFFNAYNLPNRSPHPLQIQPLFENVFSPVSIHPPFKHAHGGDFHIIRPYGQSFEMNSLINDISSFDYAGLNAGSLDAKPPQSDGRNSFSGSFDKAFNFQENPKIVHTNNNKKIHFPRLNFKQVLHGGFKDTVVNTGPPQSNTHLNSNLRYTLPRFAPERGRVPNEVNAAKFKWPRLPKKPVEYTIAEKTEYKPPVPNKMADEPASKFKQSKSQKSNKDSSYSHSFEIDYVPEPLPDIDKPKLYTVETTKEHGGHEGPHPPPTHANQEQQTPPPMSNDFLSPTSQPEYHPTYTSHFDSGSPKDSIYDPGDSTGSQIAPSTPQSSESDESTRNEESQHEVSSGKNKEYEEMEKEAERKALEYMKGLKTKNS